MDLPARIEDLLAHRHRVRGLARGLVLDESRAEDLAQEAWLAALRRPPRDGAAAPAWFRRVLGNSARLRHREEQGRARREARVARSEAIAASPSEVLERAELERRLLGLVLELEDPYRTIVLLRFFEDKSPREIALEMEAPVTTVRSRLAAALERLRSRLEREHPGGRGAWRLALLPLSGVTAAALGAGRTAAAAPAGALAVTGFVAGRTAMTAKTAIALGAGLAAILGRGRRLRHEAHDRERGPCRAPRPPGTPPASAGEDPGPRGRGRCPRTALAGLAGRGEAGPQAGTSRPGHGGERQRGDPTNLLPWCHAARLKLKDGDLEGAFADVREAVSKPRVNDYLGKNFPISQDFFRDAGHPGSVAKLLAALGPAQK